MNAQPDLDQLNPEEHLFILELGDESIRLLYAKLSAGEVVVMDGFSAESKGIEGGVPTDIKAVVETMKPLIQLCEKKHELQVQTMYVLIKSSPENDLAQRVSQAKPYLDFLDRERRGLKTFSNAHLNKIAHHSDLFDAFDSESEAFRYAFALPSRMREAIHESLVELGCFVEGFLSLPRIGVKSRAQMHPGLVLGIFPENSIVMAAMGDDLPFYRELPFGLNAAVEKVQQRLDIDRAHARRILDWVTEPPSIDTFDQGHPEDQTLYFSEKFNQLKNDIADDLDRLTLSIRQDMEHSGVWDLGFDRLYLLGEGRRFYNHFTFLRDNLPFEPHALPIPHLDAAVEGTWVHEDFAPLIRLVDYATSQRAGHRASQERDDFITQFKTWTRRVLGAEV
jgi:hypothetical protein